MKLNIGKIDISKPVSKLAHGMKVGVVKHSPEILTGLGITGMFTATVMAVRATPKALILIEERKREIRNEALDNGCPNASDKLEPVEVVKTTWKCYIPAAATGLMSVACILGANKINHKRNAALAAAYSISEATLKDYQKKVVETIGEKKEQVIRDEVAGDIIQRDPVQNHEVIITGDGNQLCYDVVSGRYFTSTSEKLKKTENILNLRLRDEMYISLNEFYYEIGLDYISIGDDIGWNINDGYIDFSFSSKLTTDDRPCLVVNYGVAPKYDYRTLM
jgi:hypothetical protein